MLVASFPSLHDAEVAARFLAEGGVASETIGLGTPAAPARRGRPRFRRRAEPDLAAGGAGAVVAVEASQVRSATELLRKIGVDRILVGDG